LPIQEIEIRPFERDHLAAAQTRLTAQEHEEVGAHVEETSRFDEPFVLIEVVERGRSLRDRQELDRTRHPLDHLPLDRLL
jgi:hypothetical protein